MTSGAPSQFSQIVRYFRDCYEADSRELSIWDVFKREHRHLQVFNGEEELLDGSLARIPVAYEVAEPAAKDQKLYERERCLLYTTFFIVGRVRDAGRIRTICAPLFYFDARLDHRNGFWFLSIDPSQENINYPLARLLRDLGGDKSADSPLEPDLAGRKLGEGGTSAIGGWLSALCPDLDLTPLIRYPRLETAEQLKLGSRKSKIGTVSLVPASAMVMVKRSSNTRGVLHELDQISRTGAASPPLRQMLLGASLPENTGQQSDPDQVPGLLNPSQKNALSLGGKHPLSLVVGPPGTGKSFTIAAIAIDRMAKGESVLIVSNTEQAVSVVAEKLTETLGVGGGLVRCGRGDYRRELKDTIDGLLHGFSGHPPRATAVSKYVKQVGQLQHKLDRAEAAFLKRCKSAMRWGRALATTTEDSGYFKRLWLWYTKSVARKAPHLWDQLQEIQDVAESRERAVSKRVTAQLRQSQAHALWENRKQFVSFSKGVRARSSKRQKDLFESIDLTMLLKALPVWLSSLEGLDRGLPLRSGLFDLVIFDEATQCDIATSIPALFRAKRAMVVGDPKQLRHVSFVSRARELRALSANGLPDSAHSRLSYRDNSILDLVDESLRTQDALVLLDEHYRSKPPLINFSNQHFYKNALRIMTERPDTRDPSCLEVVAAQGTRDARGANHDEIELLMTRLQSIIAAEKASSVPHFHSIGILSPFREQVEQLTNAVDREISSEDIARHNIRVGTAYAFQGEERDIMLISLCVDRQTSGSALAFLNRADVFNVSFTRAKSKTIVYHSADRSELKADSLLRLYLDYAAMSTDNPESGDSAYADDFRQEVREWLSQHGVSVWDGYPVAGYSMDLVCRANGVTVAIDLIGFPGDLEDFHSVHRMKLFHRAGLQVYPLSFETWRLDRDLCVQDLTQLLRLSHTRPTPETT